MTLSYNFGLTAGSLLAYVIESMLNPIDEHPCGPNPFDIKLQGFGSNLTTTTATIAATTTVIASSAGTAAAATTTANYYTTILSTIASTLTDQISNYTSNR